MKSWVEVGRFKPNGFIVTFLARKLDHGWLEIRWSGDGSGKIYAHEQTGYTPGTKALKKMLSQFDEQFAGAIYMMARAAVK
jgi:hypothetical protein